MKVTVEPWEIFFREWQQNMEALENPSHENQRGAS